MGRWLVFVCQAWTTVVAAMMRTNGPSCNPLFSLCILIYYNLLKWNKLTRSYIVQLFPQRNGSRRHRNSQITPGRLHNFYIVYNVLANS